MSNTTPPHRKPLIKRRPITQSSSPHLSQPSHPDPTVCDCPTCSSTAPPQTPLTHAITSLETELAQMRSFLQNPSAPPPTSPNCSSSSKKRNRSTIRKPLSPNALINSYTHDLTASIPDDYPPPLTTTNASNIQQQQHNCPPWPSRTSSLPPNRRNPPQSQPTTPNPSLPQASSKTLPSPPYSHTHPLKLPSNLNPKHQTPTKPSNPKHHLPTQRKPLLPLSLPLEYDPSEAEIITCYAATGFRGTVISRLRDGPRREVRVVESGVGRSGFEEGC